MIRPDLRLFVFVSLAMGLGVSLSGCGMPAGNPIPGDAPEIVPLEFRAQVPFVVRFDMRLRDADGRAIPDQVTRGDFAIRENGSPVDNTETNQFLTAGESLPLRLMIVLDYTNSMRTADAIQSMIDAATDFVRADWITASHAMGIVEFHERTDQPAGYSLVQPLITMDDAGKQRVIDAIPQADEIESGLTRVWDAVNLAMDELLSREPEFGEARAIVFLTDGNDTTSTTTREGIEARAIANGIALYPIGFGNVAASAEDLRSLAAKTDGIYLPAENKEAIQTVFSEIARDLRGQWSLTYITQKNAGTVEAEIQFNWNNQQTSQSIRFDAAELAGDINEGVIRISEPSYDEDADLTRFTVRAEYIPRNVGRFRFRLDHAATFLLQGIGGLTNPDDGWQVEASSSEENTFDITGPTALEFGAFGNIGTLILPGNISEISVTHDDGIYEDLAQPKTMRIIGG